VQRFSTTVQDGGRGRVLIPVPFDPNEVWATKPRHHVAGTVNSARIRGVVDINEGVWGFLLGAAWLRGCRLEVGDLVQVELMPEGPQRSDLAVDVAAALDANPQAGAFFDSLAQFYRRGYLRWIDATKRRPDLRAQRITTMIDLLSAGVKDYHNE
jgi:hypothetical protein